MEFSFFIFYLSRFFFYKIASHLACNFVTLVHCVLRSVTEQNIVMTVRLVDSIDVTRWWLADAKLFGKLKERVNIQIMEQSINISGYSFVCTVSYFCV